MEKEIISKEIAQELIEIKGEVRGVVFKTDREYILKEKGEGGLAKVEEELERLGTPIRYKHIKTMAFYPIGLRVVSLLTIKKAFNFDNEKIREMGLFATKVSLIIKLFIKYFLSLKKVFFEEAPKIWSKHWTVGKLVSVRMNEDEKYGILRVEDFNLHPVVCYYLQGYFAGILQMVVRSKKVTAEEVKCTFSGEDCHEYMLRWT